MDLDAVEAHPTTPREVKVLAQVGGMSSSEARFLRRVLRYDAATEGFSPLLVLSSQEVQDGRHSWLAGHWYDSARWRPEARWERDSRLQDRRHQ